MIATTATTDTLNSLLRGELSAVETYEQALGKLRDTKGASELGRIQEEHRDAVETLSSYIHQEGGEPETTSGAWGVFARLVEGAAKLFGDNATLKALKEGEEHGIKMYEASLEDGSLLHDCKTSITTRLLPQTQAHVSVLDRLMAGLVERITPQEARQHVAAGALLICAYDSREEYEQNRLEGSTSLDEFKSSAGSTAKNRELIFYCACPSEGTAAGVAEKYQHEGFTNVKALFGGVDAWKQAGY